MKIQELRKRRKSAGISGSAVSLKAGIHRSRLCDIERGYVEPSSDEVTRLNAALSDLITARQKVAAIAEEVGWPM